MDATSPIANPPRWGRIYLTWLTACAGHPNMLRVLTVISKYAGAKGFAWPAVRRIADEAEISVRQTYYALAKLRGAGVIEDDEDEYGQGGYRLHPIPKAAPIISARKRRRETNRYDDERHAHTIRENSERDKLYALRQQRDISGRIADLPDRLKARLLGELIVSASSHLEWTDEDSPTSQTRWSFYRFGKFCEQISCTVTQADSDGYYELGPEERALFRSAVGKSDHAWTDQEVLDYVAQIKTKRDEKSS